MSLTSLFQINTRRFPGKRFACLTFVLIALIFAGIFPAAAQDPEDSSPDPKAYYRINCGQSEEEVTDGPYARYSQITLIKKPDNFTCPGFVFSGWKSWSTGRIYQEGDSFIIEEEIEEIFHAQWAPANTITYDGNGGEISEGLKTQVSYPYASGSETKVLANQFDRIGYSFAGWNTSPNGGGTGYNAEEPITVDKDITLYAQWTPNSQPTTCNVKVTSSGNGDAYASVTSGNTWDVVKLTAIPAEGYFFSTWEVISGGVVVTNNQFTIGTSDVEINAIFSQQRTYKVTVLTEGWGVVRVKPPKDYFNSGEVVELFPDATEDWEFAEWRGAKVTENQFTVGTSDVWITAVFRRRQTNKLRTDFIYVLADGNKGIPPDINAALWEDLTIQLLDKDNNTVAESKYFTLDIKSENSYTVTMEDLEYYGSLTEQDLAPGKYAVSISGLPETMDDKWGNPNPGRPRYKIESDAEINEKDGCMVVTVYIYFYDNPEIIVDAPKPQPGLPEDSTGAYYFDEDGIKKYALYQTYLDCMRGLGQDELCRSHERCYHK